MSLASLSDAQRQTEVDETKPAIADVDIAFEDPASQQVRNDYRQLLWLSMVRPQEPEKSWANIRRELGFLCNRSPVTEATEREFGAFLPTDGVAFAASRLADEGEETELSDLGMTPTPSKVIAGESDELSEMDFIPTPTLDGLLDDDCREPTRPARWSDCLPHFSCPKEAAAFLATGRSDLDMDLQRRLLSFASNDVRTEWMTRQQRESTLPADTRRYALNALVAEAARRAVCSRRVGADGRKHCARAWRALMKRVTHEHDMEGAQIPQRNLSCMCIFSPQRMSAYPPPYGDSAPESHSRTASQMAVLRALGLQRAMGSPSLFLRSDAPPLEGEVPFMIQMA